MTIRVDGLDELRAKLAPELYGPALRDLFESAVAQVEDEADRRAPRHTGQLAASISSKIDSKPVPEWGEVRAGAFYAHMVHGGTKPHWPPPDRLAGWAAAHGISPSGGFLVARSISRRGVKPRRFLRNAARKVARNSEGLVKEFAAAIERAWES